MLSTVLKAVGGGSSENSVETGVDAVENAGNFVSAGVAHALAPLPKVGMVMDASEISWGIMPIGDTPRFAYSRPDFLFLTTDDEITVSGDQTTRPVLVPKDPQKMLMFSGYAETINAGKTALNEDQACCRVLKITATSTHEFSHSDSKGMKNTRKKRTRSVDPGSMQSGIISRFRRTSDEDLLHANNAKPDNENLPGAEDSVRVEANYFAIFDGHAGTGSALMAYNCLHEHIRERLSAVINLILDLDEYELISRVLAGHNNSHIAWKNAKTGQLNGSFERMNLNKNVTRDSLVVGALENAFIDMDEQIHEEKLLWRIPGGCAAIVAVFLLGKLYIANAGDCRAVLCTGSTIEQMSSDFTPVYERKRLQFLAFRQPELLDKAFSRLEYDRNLMRSDLRKKVLVRDWYMDGWCQKTVREADLRPPMINANHRKCRLLNTIGVTRGFGDHHLITVGENLALKPFLTPVPQVSTFNLSSLDVLTEKDVLILASDGLWDVMTNEEASAIVQTSLESQNSECDWAKYTLAAQDLVIAARGQPHKANKRWSGLDEGGKASTDDITVFVVPLKFASNSALSDEDDVELLR